MKKVKQLLPAISVLILCISTKAQNTFPSSGNVGIGTTSPGYRLQINNPSNDRIATFVGGSSLLTRLSLYVADNAASMGTETNSKFGLYVNGTTAMTILASGNIGIGVEDPSEKLSVLGNASINGYITTKKVIVMQSGWPDYVFHPSYKLRPLSEVARFIRQNQHLPDVPSAREVDERGVNVGDNQALLLKKIEELTLYLIELTKTNERMQKEIKELRHTISRK